MPPYQSLDATIPVLRCYHTSFQINGSPLVLRCHLHQHTSPKMIANHCFHVLQVIRRSTSAAPHFSVKILKVSSLMFTTLFPRTPFSTGGFHFPQVKFFGSEVQSEAHTKSTCNPRCSLQPQVLDYTSHQHNTLKSYYYRCLVHILIGALPSLHLEESHGEPSV